MYQTIINTASKALGALGVPPPVTKAVAGFVVMAIALIIVYFVYQKYKRWREERDYNERVVSNLTAAQTANLGTTYAVVNDKGKAVTSMSTVGFAGKPENPWLFGVKAIANVAVGMPVNATRWTWGKLTHKK